MQISNRIFLLVQVNNVLQLNKTFKNNKLFYIKLYIYIYIYILLYQSTMGNTVTFFQTQQQLRTVGGPRRSIKLKGWRGSRTKKFWETLLQRTENQGLDSPRARDLIPFQGLRGDLGPTQCHVQWVQLECLLGEKRENGEFLPFWADFNNASSCASKSPLQINYVVITYSPDQVYIQQTSRYKI